MNDLAQKIKESRKLIIKVGEMTFFARRLTFAEYCKISHRKVDEHDFLTDLDIVSGWDGVRESDLFIGGGDDPVEFDSGLFSLAIVDMADAYSEISNTVVSETMKFLGKKEDNEKNSEAGTTKASEKQK